MSARESLKGHCYIGVYITFVCMFLLPDSVVICGRVSSKCKRGHLFLIILFAMTFSKHLLFWTAVSSGWLLNVNTEVGTCELVLNECWATYCLESGKRKQSGEGRCYQNEKAEAQRNKMMCPGSHSKSMAECSLLNLWPGLILLPASKQCHSTSCLPHQFTESWRWRLFSFPFPRE